jgi:hypothetical protein
MVLKNMKKGKRKRCKMRKKIEKKKQGGRKVSVSG